MPPTESGSAGNIVAAMVVEYEQTTVFFGLLVFYGLGRKFGSAARKHPW
jgi:hypothetical protein